MLDTQLVVSDINVEEGKFTASDAVFVLKLCHLPIPAYLNIFQIVLTT